ncbi:hypothetical protein OEA41_010380 [Lepraria neglecta]|uniref:Uncharacterized protein n=1 Tax=Lepraria neglecta TaxID=209136 RepID=A0AAD9YWG8_9LECA|nr:hypothetical protein OEA41_010380 [Lepraria neglecta]
MDISRAVVELKCGHPALEKLYAQLLCTLFDVKFLETVVGNVENCSNVSGPMKRIAHEFLFEHWLKILLVTRSTVDANLNDIQEDAHRLQYDFKTNDIDTAYTDTLNDFLRKWTGLRNKVQFIMMEARACIDNALLDKDNAIAQQSLQPNQLQSLQHATPGDILYVCGLSEIKRKKFLADAMELWKDVQNSPPPDLSVIAGESIQYWKLVQMSQRAREALRKSQQRLYIRLWEIEHPGEEYAEPPLVPKPENLNLPSLFGPAFLAMARNQPMGMAPGRGLGPQYPGNSAQD